MEFSCDSAAKLGNQVRLVDSNDAGLELYCSVRDENEVLRQWRGIVLHKDQGVVMKAFPYTIEMVENEADNITKSLENIFDKCTFFDAHEGALIRMFYFDDKWYITTHRKLDAFRSKWASKESYGTTFLNSLKAEKEHNKRFNNLLPNESDDILINFENILDKNKQYMFLIRNTKENRIVCSAPDTPTVYHVGTFVDGVLTMNEDIGIPYPTQHSFKNVNDLLTFVDKCDPRNFQGIFIFAPNNTQYKIIQQDYHELFLARGNQPSVKFRYLEVRMNQRQTDMLYYLYPDMAEEFDNYENIIYEIAMYIYKAYVQRFIKKMHVRVPTEEYIVMKQCHKWHEEDRSTNRISLNKVMDILNTQKPSNINHMRKHYLSGEHEKMEVKQELKFRKRTNTTSSPQQLSLKPLLSNTKKMEALNLNNDD
jgi:hypothetical protein